MRLLATVAVALAVASRTVAQAGTGVDDAGVCARCHEAEVSLAVATAGHASGVDCGTCHADRRPGRFGRRHRAIPRCASCHQETRHPTRAHGRAPQPTRNCLACHDPHGSPNASLVRPAIRARPRVFVPVRFENETGAGAGGFTDPAAPGAGLCEVCHRRTDVYRADGGGEAHFTASCILCHDHRAGFAALVTDQNCQICHTDEAARFTRSNAHSATFACSGCHAEVTPAAAPGHRRVPACIECHDRQTHAPAGHEPFPCTQCHDAHGTANTHLVLDVLVTTQETERPIRFDNISGRVDGSFASASAPGSGICEVCHTATRFYRADGTGEEHFTFSCLPCHRHDRGFTPP